MRRLFEDWFLERLRDSRINFEVVGWDSGAPSLRQEPTRALTRALTVRHLRGLGHHRKEMAMCSGPGRQHNTSAQQQGKQQKLFRQKKFNKVNERQLGPYERAMSKEAKVKELKSFFNHHVWVSEIICFV